MLPTADYIVPVEIESQTHNVYVIKRPGVDHFLKEMGKTYEVVVFTASLSKVGPDFKFAVFEYQLTELSTRTQCLTCSILRTLCDTDSFARVAIITKAIMSR